MGGCGNNKMDTYNGRMGWGGFLWRLGDHESEIFGAHHDLVFCGRNLADVGSIKLLSS
jgi:hypothetical protein